MCSIDVVSSLLPQGLSRRDTPPPPEEPSTYGSDYRLPEHSSKPLSELHTDEKASHLRFYEKPHVYTWKGVPVSTSVTALAHEHETPFVAKDAIRLMKTSRRQAWPRLEYVKGVVPVGRGSDILQEKKPMDTLRGHLAHVDGKTISVVHPMSVSGHDACLASLLVSAARIPTSEFDIENADVYAYDEEMTDEEIQSMWEEKGMLASHMGTEAHYQAELLFNGLPFRSCPETDVVLRFAKAYLLPRGMVAYATEKEIVSEDADVAGSIDLILHEPSTGKHHILDFKRSDKLARDLLGYSKMKPPFQHLHDCKVCSYALQTSLYQHILETDYGMTIGSRILLSLHPDAPVALVVPCLSAETDYIMSRRRRLVEARKRVASSFPEMRCFFTGFPCVDAVTVKDDSGNTFLAMEKAATLREVTFQVAPEARARFEEAVQVELSKDQPVSFDSRKSLPWSKHKVERIDF